MEMDVPQKVTRLITDQQRRQWRAKECAAPDGSWVLEERVEGAYEYRACSIWRPEPISAGRRNLATSKPSQKT
ncbi:hypothetical protein AHiyo8_pI66480 (plasmid) [Arthrobacter sp. Hiyo8]|nr:hypothetical protein AHiyo8_pI66480 [Arthrobacter sp. Hiyo8]